MVDGDAGVTSSIDSTSSSSPRSVPASAAARAQVASKPSSARHSMAAAMPANAVSVTVPASSRRAIVHSCGSGPLRRSRDRYQGHGVCSSPSASGAIHSAPVPDGPHSHFWPE